MYPRKKSPEDSIESSSSHEEPVPKQARAQIRGQSGSRREAACQSSESGSERGRRGSRGRGSGRGRRGRRLGQGRNCTQEEKVVSFIVIYRIISAKFV